MNHFLLALDTAPEVRHEEGEDRRTPNGGGLRDSWRPSATTRVSEGHIEGEIVEGREDRHQNESGGVRQWALPKMPDAERATEDAALYTVASSGDRGTFSNHAGFQGGDFATSAEDANAKEVTSSAHLAEITPKKP